jgi:exopolysaccharide biosynthesis polyprenyl glycosylphosphotransferase
LGSREHAWFRRVTGAALDVALLWFSFWFAHALRYRFEVGGQILPWNDEPFSTFYRPALLFVVLTVGVFLLRQVYTLPRSTSLLDEASLVVGGLVTAMAGVILAAYFFRFLPSRLVFLYAWLGAIVLLLARRALARQARRWLWARGIGVERVLVVGTGEAGQRVMEALLGQASFGRHLVGYVDDAVEERLAVAGESGVTWVGHLGSADEVGEIAKRDRIDEVIVALPAGHSAETLGIVEQCRDGSVRFRVVPDLLQLSLDRVDLEEVAGVPLIGVQEPSIRGWNSVVKRLMDVAIAAVVLAVGTIPMVLIAVAIRLDSRGPVLCRQRRVGRLGREFTLVKFRSMVEDAEGRRADAIATAADADRRLFKRRDDPRRTRVGRVLRRWSLDELPQFWHVLRGEMSVVGPRPPLPEEVAGYDEWHRERLLVTPGLTGLWQVNGRSDLTFDEMVRLDLYYADHWSPWLDVKVILRTIPAVLTGRGAY